MIHGIDVSRHQGSVDFAAAAAGGFRFALIKATEGKDHLDDRFHENWDKLLALDPGTVSDGPTMYRGVYHFARQDLRPDQGRSAGELEARFLCDTLKGVGNYSAGAFPPALDWEKYGGKSSTNREWIRGFIHVVYNELGRYPMVYTGSNVWYYTTDDWDELLQLYLWQVAYSRSGSDPNASPPTIPRKDGRDGPWEYTLWQHSGGGDFAYYPEQHGPIPGIPSGIADVNRHFSGSEDDLAALAMMDLVGPTPPPPPTLPPTPPQSKVGRGIMPILELSEFQSQDPLEVIRVLQGLLMANGQGPDGLVGSNGLPDGWCGDKTRLALKAFKQDHGLPVNLMVDANTWWLLLSP